MRCIKYLFLTIFIVAHFYGFSAKELDILPNICYFQLLLLISSLRYLNEVCILYNRQINYEKLVSRSKNLVNLQMGM